MKRSNLQLYDSHGRAVFLADKLKQGGEGAVYHLRDRPEHVAKIYSAPVDTSKTEKLDLMVRLRTDRLIKLTAWPVDTLFERPNGRLVGFLMPKMVGYEDVHIVYGIKSRLAQFPNAGWPFLIQTASNIARAFKLVHEQNHVIGDINHGSVGVAKNATVVLFDCDSFQITANGRRYPCTVGIDTHTPPELQAQSLTNVVRSANHDAFGLAVIIFQLLFLGRHPFAGKVLDAGETPPLQKLIAEYRFAYGPGARSRRMEPPTGAIPLEAVSSVVANLFERAFGRSGLRPTAAEWIEPLNSLASNLRQCAANAAHHYLKTLPVCPWCRVEGSAGVLVFMPVYAVGVSRDGHFDLVAVWAKISAISSPGPLPALPQRSRLKVNGSAEAKKIQRWQFLQSVAIGAALFAASLLLFLFPLTASGSALLIGIVGIVAAVVSRKSFTMATEKFGHIRVDKQRHWRELEQRWTAQAGPKTFEEKLRQLKARKAEYEALPALRLKKLTDLQRNVRERQLEKFLDRHLIATARLSGIGPGRQATLRSFGIETAADINRHAISNVPGFGPVYTWKLMDWRNSIAQRFVFNPAMGVDAADKNAVEKEFASAKSVIERDLQNGAVQLGQISYQINNARTTMCSTLENGLTELVQAERDAGKGLPAVLHLSPVFLGLIASLLMMAPLKTRFGTWQATQQSVVVPTSSPSPSTVPTPTIEQQRAEAQLRYIQGTELTKTRQYKEAITCYQQAITLNPDLFEAHHELAFALYKTGKYQESIAEAEQAIRIRSDNKDTYRTLGLSHSALKKWEEATTAFDKALEIDPDDATTYYQIAFPLKGSGKLDEAVEALQGAIQLKSDFAAAHYELGLIYVQRNEIDAASAELHILSEMNTRFAQKLADKIATIIPDPTPEASRPRIVIP